ncbi:MAG TPA: beta-ketoacyl-ACP synthase III [Spirochaetota bacterium]|nr:beta-ketoacyl-ACP synthase III [Spirochaetota bacterium]HPH01614.1 beta-ketoacyl-ACP synthase III [Spirochaetota bacterium]HPN82423.1 beta-ketoacyl-ACP synthase III [Spirochaetota bacterium]
MTNVDIEKLVETSDEWIRERTGIRQRHICAPGESASDLAVAACKRMQAEFPAAFEGIDFILVATTTPDHPLFPSVASLVGNRLGLGFVPCVDLSAACTGFVYSLSAATAWIRSGMYKKILLVCVDTLSHFLDWTDRSTCILFGDGAGAMILEAGPEDSPSDALGFELHADGGGSNMLIVPEGGSRKPFSAETLANRGQFLRMDGPAVYKFAINAITESVNAVLEKSSLRVSDITHFIPHQANIRIIDSAAKKIGLAPDVIRTNLDRCGNTSSASIPIVLDELNRQGKLTRGDILVTVGFGAGLTWGASVLRW